VRVGLNDSDQGFVEHARGDHRKRVPEVNHHIGPTLGD
jgi:hypothetical protein